MNSKRHTKNGFSHKSLIKRAKELRKSESISHSQALLKVAQEASYPSWKSIVKEEINSARDSFFSEGFGNRSKYEEGFKRYKDSKNLNGSPSDYRNYLVHLYEAIESGEREQDRLATKTIKIDTFLKEFILKCEETGAESILPQNLPDYLLYPALTYTKKFLSQSDELTPEEGYALKVIIDGVTMLKAHNILIKNPGRSPTFQFTYEEVLKALEIYSIRLDLEVVRRQTKHEIEAPTVESFFDDEVGITLCEETFNLLTK